MGDWPQGSMTDSMYARCLRAQELRDQGKLLREIGDDLGISIGRVGQMLKQVARRRALASGN